MIGRLTLSPGPHLILDSHILEVILHILIAKSKEMLVSHLLANEREALKIEAQGAKAVNVYF